LAVSPNFLIGSSEVMWQEKKRVRWSELGCPTMAGTHRLGAHAVVQINYPLIQQYHQVGGDPWLEITPHPIGGRLWVAVRMVADSE
jgi:hypothetical protein